MTSNINDDYFNGFYQEIWRQTVPPQTTAKEVSFIVDELGIPPDGKILDVMCGYGRHSLPLAAKGFRVTALDNLKEYTDEIQKQADAENLEIRVLNSSLTEFEVENTEYHLCICMGNSLNFFPEKDVRGILSVIYESLNPGGKILINTWSLIEIVTKGFVSNHWSKFKELTLLSESNYLFNPTRIETHTTVLENGNVAETKYAIDYLFSLTEFTSILADIGFTNINCFSIPGRKKFVLGDPRAYFVATKGESD